MNKAQHNQEFDKAVKERFEGNETSPPAYMWSKVSNAVTTSNKGVLLTKVKLFRWISVGLVCLLGVTVIYYEVQDSGGDEVNTSASTVIDSDSSSIIEIPGNDVSQFTSGTNNNKGEGFNLKGYVELSPLGELNPEKVVEHLHSNLGKNDPVHPLSRVDTSVANLGGMVTFSQGSYPDPSNSSVLRQVQRHDSRGVESVALPLKMVEQLDKINVLGVVANAESFSFHPDLLEERSDTMQIIWYRHSFRSRWVLGAQFAPQYSYHKIKPNPNVSGLDLGVYQESESGKWTWSGGLNVGFELNSNWTLYSGIHFSRYEQQFESDLAPFSLDTIQGTCTFNSSLGAINANCEDIEDHQNENQGGQVGNNNNNNEDEIGVFLSAHQRMQFVRIPLLIEYQFGKRKWHLFARAGISLNLINAARIEGFAGQEGDYDAVDFSDYKDQFNNSYALNIGGGIGYHFLSAWELALQPEFSYSVTPINQMNSIHSRPYTIGLTTRLHFKLF